MTLETVGRTNSERETHLWRTYDIYLRRHLGQRLLLQHSCEASKIPHCVTQDHLEQQAHILLTQFYLAHRNGSKCNCCSDG